jgi:hypothetical protein
MSCPECQAYCQELKRVNNLLSHALTLSSSPADLTDRILTVVQQQVQTTPKKEFTWVDFLIRALSYSVTTIGLVAGIAFVWLFMQVGQERLTQGFVNLFYLGIDHFQQSVQSMLVLAEKKWLDLYLFPETFSSMTPLELFLQTLYQPWLLIAVIISLLWAFIAFYQWIKLIHRFRSV